MYVVALTGGIGSGKSEAAKQFAALSVPIVDVDAISHTLTASDNPFLMKIKEVFNDGVFNPDQSLNRAKLRALVLADPKQRIKLEQLMHPVIYDEALRQLKKNQQELQPDYQVLVIPLLFENNRYQSVVNKVIVIDCDEELQIKRAMARSQLCAAEVRAMMNAQITRENRLKLADEIIENNGSLARLKTQINKLHKKLIKTCAVSK
jgi:dephospho-CoA kinase